MFYLEGSRNARLYKLAYAMFCRGESYDAVLKEVLKENTFCKDKNGKRDPLPVKEIRTLVQSASKYSQSGEAAKAKPKPKPEELFQVLEPINPALGNLLSAETPAEEAEAQRLMALWDQTEGKSCTRCHQHPHTVLGEWCYACKKETGTLPEAFKEA